MDFKKTFFFGCLFVMTISYQASAQRNYGGSNFLGITGGYTIFDINTSDFVTKPTSGFLGGLSTRGAFRDDFDLVYGISFQNAKIMIEGERPTDSKREDINYTIQGVQVNIFGSYNIVKEHLSVELGPVFNINGKMKLDDDKFEDHVLAGNSMATAKDIQEISKFDFRVAAGITAGLRNFRLLAQYQYGLTNTLAALNKRDELVKSDFKGNTSTIIFGAVVYF